LKAVGEANVVLLLEEDFQDVVAPWRSSANRGVARFLVFTHWRSPGGYGSRSRFATIPSRPRS